MSIPNVPDVPNDATLDQLRQVVAQGFQEIFYQLSGFLNSKNVLEVGGWKVGDTELQAKTKTVGMSTAITGADDIRFWAGDVKTGSPPFYVTESGKMYATDGNFTGTITGSTITGGTIQTGTTGSSRIVISNNSLKTYNSSNQFNGFAWGIDVSGSTFGDAFLYHNGTKLVQFIDEIANYRISATGAGFMTIGSPATTTFASGSWSFSGTVTGLSTDFSGFHDHGISGGVTLATTSDGSTVDGYVTWVPSGSHSHNVS